MNRLVTLLVVSVLTLTTACAASTDRSDENDQQPVDPKIVNVKTDDSRDVSEGTITPQQRMMKCCQYFPKSGEWICWEEKTCGWF